MSDAEYYAQRERAERELALSAMAPNVRDIHLVLADKYAELAGRVLLEPFGNLRVA